MSRPKARCLISLCQHFSKRVQGKTALESVITRLFLKFLWSKYLRNTRLIQVRRVPRPQGFSEPTKSLFLTVLRDHSSTPKPSLPIFYFPPREHMMVKAFFSMKQSPTQSLKSLSRESKSVSQKNTCRCTITHSRTGWQALASV